MSQLKKKKKILHSKCLSDNVYMMHDKLALVTRYYKQYPIREEYSFFAQSLHSKHNAFIYRF